MVQLTTNLITFTHSAILDSALAKLGYIYFAKMVNSHHLAVTCSPQKANYSAWMLKHKINNPNNLIMASVERTRYSPEIRSIGICRAMYISARPCFKQPRAVSRLLKNFSEFCYDFSQGNIKLSFSGLAIKAEPNFSIESV